MSKHDRAAHEVHDLALVEQRVRLGDATEIVRDVDHAAVFRSMASAKAAASELERRGMRVDAWGRYWWRPFHVIVTFRRAQRTDLESVRSVTDELVDLCSQHDGYYDGWGSMVVTGAQNA